MYSDQTELITTDYSKQWECDFQVNEITCVDTLHQNTNTSHNQGIVTLYKLKLGFKNDIHHEKLIASVRSGFLESKMKTEPDLRPLWEFWNRLSCSDDLVWLNNRIVIPKNYQSQILNVLHSAHQGVNSMMKRVNQTVYWPGIMSSIRNMWYKCQICNSIAPSQSKEPLIISKTPEYPFQYICADYFEIKENHYLAVLDRFSSWIMIYHFPPRKLNHQSLIDLC